MSNRDVGRQQEEINWTRFTDLLGRIDSLKIWAGQKLNKWLRIKVSLENKKGNMEGSRKSICLPWSYWDTLKNKKLDVGYNKIL